MAKKEIITCDSCNSILKPRPESEGYFQLFDPNYGAKQFCNLHCLHAYTSDFSARWKAEFGPEYE